MSGGYSEMIVPPDSHDLFCKHVVVFRIDVRRAASKYGYGFAASVQASLMSRCINAESKAAYNDNARARDLCGKSPGRAFSVWCCPSRAYYGDSRLAILRKSASYVDTERRSRNFPEKRRKMLIFAKNESDILFF